MTALALGTHAGSSGEASREEAELGSGTMNQAAMQGRVRRGSEFQGHHEGAGRVEGRMAQPGALLLCLSLALWVNCRHLGPVIRKWCAGISVFR